MPISSSMSTLNGVHLFNTHLFKNDELKLGKNVMLFGTNGVGKSTSLAFLAFFWSGEQNLFIKEKSKADGKRFQDYFFPANNSFLVYLYEKEEHDVLAVIAGKESGNGLMCYFVALSKGSYDVENIFNRDTRADVLNAIDEVKISYDVYPFSQYKQILYGQTSKKEDKKYAFSQIRNYRTYAKLHYSSFKNIAIDSKAVKNIILEYAEAVKEGYGKEGLNLEEYGREINIFLSKHDAISLWHKNYHTIEKLKDGLYTLRSTESKRLEALLEMQRERSWYISLAAELGASLSTKNIEYDNFKTDVHPKESKRLKDERRQKQDELNDLKNSINGIKKRYKEYQENHKLQVMIKESPKKEEYSSQLQSAKKILEGLEEKNKPAAEQHENRLASIAQAYDETLVSSEQYLTRLINDFLERELRENKQASEAIEDLKSDYAFIGPLENECQKIEIQKVKLESDMTVLSKETFDGSTRCKGIDKELSEIRSKKDKLSSKESKLEDRSESLRNEEERFRKKQRGDLEAKKKSSEEELREIGVEIERLNSLDDLEGSLYSKIEQAGLDTQKYTSLLNLEALESIDFTLSPDTAGDGMQVFDFLLSKDTQLFSQTPSIAQRKEELRERKARIRKSLRIFEDTQETAYKEFFSSHRPKVAVCNTELNSVRDEYRAADDKHKALKDTRIIAEEKWTEEHQVKISTLKEEIETLSAKLAKDKEHVVASKGRLKESISEIKGNVFKSEPATKKAKKEREEKDKSAKEEHDKDIKMAEEAYKEALSATGSDPKEVIAYKAKVLDLGKKLEEIMEWNMTILDYQEFLQEEWSRMQGLEAKFSQESEAFNIFDSDIENELENLRKKEEELKSDVDRIRTTKDTLEEKSKTLNEYLEDNMDLLENVEPIREKTEEEKRETDFNKETIELIGRFSSATNSNAKARKEIDLIMSKHWSTFIAKGILLDFTSDTLSNAKRIVDADSADEVETISLGVFQSIRQTISIISDRSVALSSTYSEAKNAINKITRDLKDISSTTLIEKIEIRAVDKESGIQRTMDRMVDYWRAHSEHMMDGLFSQEDDNVHKKEMLERFGAFTKELQLLSSREKTLSVGGMFDLQGRIVEKGNDSGWVNGALGQGSEGTKILIKAAITASLFSMALSGSKEQHIPTILIDEIGKLHNDNVQRILEYINQKGAYLVAVQPNNTMAKFFDSAYLLDEVSKTESQVVEYIRKKKTLTFKENADVSS